MVPEMASEMETLKARLKATWMVGDYGTFAEYLEPGALGFLVLQRHFCCYGRRFSEP